MDQVLELEVERNNSFNAACSTVGCPIKVNLKGKMTSEEVNREMFLII